MAYRASLTTELSTRREKMPFRTLEELSESGFELVFLFLLYSLSNEITLNILVLVYTFGQATPSFWSSSRRPRSDPRSMRCTKATWWTTITRRLVKNMHSEKRKSRIKLNCKDSFRLGPLKMRLSSWGRTRKQLFLARPRPLPWCPCSSASKKWKFALILNRSLLKN